MDKNDSIKYIEKKTYITNPITGEERLYTVRAAIPEDQKNYAKLGIDINKMVDNAIRKEIDLATGRATIDAIVEYAQDNNNVHEFDLPTGDYSYDTTLIRADKIIWSLYDFVSNCKDPIIYTNTAIASLLSDSGIINKFDHKGNFDVFCYKIGDKIFTYNDPDREIRTLFYCIPTWEWNKTEIVAYDLDNAKKCIYLKYNIL